MLVVTIRRHTRSDAGTQGSATLSNSPDRFDTLEPRDSIQSGTYRACTHKIAEIRNGFNAYRRVYGLIDVEDHDRPDIDFGEFAGDIHKGMHNNMLGAIAIGFGFTRKLPGNGTYRAQLALQNSRIALAKLMSHTHGLAIFVDIIDLP
jgi:hypothetical protein